jgi:hypothetical protein
VLGHAPRLTIQAVACHTQALKESVKMLLSALNVAANRGKLWRFFFASK